jgi:hypothetical protein
MATEDGYAVVDLVPIRLYRFAWGAHPLRAFLSAPIRSVLDWGPYGR